MTFGTDRLDQMIAGRHESSPCGISMSLPLVGEYKPGYVKCIHAIDAKFVNSRGVVFGGYLSALLDDVTGHAAMTVIPDGKVCATAELSISYFRPCRPSDGDLVLEGLVVNQSRRSLHIEATLRRCDGKLICKGYAVYAISDRT